jgi:hypothetical protein
MSLPSAKAGRWSVVAGVVVVALVAGLIGQTFVSPPAARAQVPDSGAQFNEMVKELRIANQKLTEIAGLLREMRDAQAPAKGGSESKPPPKK